MKHPVPGPAVASEISQLKRTNRVSAVVGIAMLVFVVCIAIWSLQQAASAEYWVTHTYQVLNLSYQLEFDLKDTQASFRAYILQPTQAYRSDFEAATGRANESFAKLKSLTPDNAAQQARLDELGPLLDKRTKRIEERMSVRDQAELPSSPPQGSCSPSIPLHTPPRVPLPITLSSPATRSGPPSAPRSRPPLPSRVWTQPRLRALASMPLAP